MKYPLILVKWLDAVSGHGWDTIENVENSAHEILTMGFLVKENKESIGLVMSLDHVHEYQNCTFVIPKGMIKSIQPLAVRKSSKKRR